MPSLVEVVKFGSRWKTGPDAGSANIMYANQDGGRIRGAFVQEGPRD